MEPLALRSRAPPLGNQNRARRRLYFEMSRYRQGKNGESHAEPTGHEQFD
ncbi:hypothetical protein ACFSLT_01355 [Novosphingobium resinovorum]